MGRNCIELCTCAHTHTHMHTELYQGQYLSFDTENVNIGGLALGDHSIHFFANSCVSIIISKFKKRYDLVQSFSNANVHVYLIKI